MQKLLSPVIKCRYDMQDVGCVCNKRENVMKHHSCKSSKKNAELGASLVETALLVALIALVSTGSLKYLAQQVEKPLRDVVQEGFDTATGIAPPCTGPFC